MHTHTPIPALLVALLLCLPSIGRGQSQAPDQLGQVDFANSCRAAVQGILQRGVAMLHSFWFRESEKTFREVLATLAAQGLPAARRYAALAPGGPPYAAHAVAHLHTRWGLGGGSRDQRTLGGCRQACQRAE
jgi:hypothetical protein